MNDDESRSSQGFEVKKLHDPSVALTNAGDEFPILPVVKLRWVFLLSQGQLTGVALVSNNEVRVETLQKIASDRRTCVMTTQKVIDSTEDDRCPD